MTARFNAILNEILDIEWEMLRAVQTAEPVAGKEGEKSFRLLRWMAYSALTEELLGRVLGHLQEAREEGRNVMIEKYARMGGQIPPLSDSPFIPRIADIEEAWLHAVQRRYPLTFPETQSPFRAHLMAELETFPEDYLEALHTFTASCKEAGRNLVEERYERLFQHLGHASIQACEHKALLDSRRCSCS